MNGRIRWNQILQNKRPSTFDVYIETAIFEHKKFCRLSKKFQKSILQWGRSIWTGQIKGGTKVKFVKSGIQKMDLPVAKIRAYLK